MDGSRRNSRPRRIDSSKGRAIGVAYTPIGSADGSMQLWLNPLIAAGHQCRVWYVPRPVTPTQDTDIVDGVAGWEEYIVVDAWRKAWESLDRDASNAQRAKAEQKDRIESMAARRDRGSAHHVVSTSSGWPELTDPGRLW